MVFSRTKPNNHLLNIIKRIKWHVIDLWRKLNLITINISSILYLLCLYHNEHGLITSQPGSAYCHVQEGREELGKIPLVVAGIEPAVPGLLLRRVPTATQPSQKCMFTTTNKRFWSKIKLGLLLFHRPFHDPSWNKFQTILMGRVLRDGAFSGLRNARLSN